MESRPYTIYHVSSGPPTPSMTEGHTHSDVSTTTSAMSDLLQQKLRARKAELQREGRLSEDSPEKSSADEEDVTTSSAKGIKIGKGGKRDVAMPGRRVVSMATSRKAVASMGFKEQEEHVSKLEKQGFDLKLKVYHQDRRINELQIELQSKTDDNAELMRLVDDQQKELDRREASLKEAVDAILLLQDKVRHLEKLAKHTGAQQVDGAATVRTKKLPYGENPVLDEERSQTSVGKKYQPQLSVHPPSSSYQGSDVSNDHSNGIAATGLTPLIDQLDDIHHDRRGLRVRTLSALSRQTDESRPNPPSPTMSVLSEGDFESVYNWKGRMEPKRRYSADLLDLWRREEEDTMLPHETNLFNQRMSDHLEEEDTILPHEVNLSNQRPVEAAAPTTPNKRLPDLEISNTFSRRRATQKGNSGSSTQVIAAKMKPVVLTPSRPPRITLDTNHRASSSRNSHPKTPDESCARRLGRFDEYGFLDSQPTTPVLLGKRVPTVQAACAEQKSSAPPPVPPHRNPERLVPDKSLDSSGKNQSFSAKAQDLSVKAPTLSAKDQQILSYIAQQRNSEWIHPKKGHRPALAGPMFMPESRSSSKRATLQSSDASCDSSGHEADRSRRYSSRGVTNMSHSYNSLDDGEANPCAPAHHEYRPFLSTGPVAGPGSQSIPVGNGDSDGLSIKVHLSSVQPPSRPGTEEEMDDESAVLVDDPLVESYDGSAEAAPEKKRNHPPVTLRGRRGLPGWIRRRGSSNAGGAGGTEPREDESRMSISIVSGSTEGADGGEGDEVDFGAQGGGRARRRASFAALKLGKVGRRIF